MAFYLTNAPDDYDYSYVKTVQELGTVTGERGKWRVIEDSDTEGRFADYQKPRYHSGLYSVYPANGPDAKRMGVTISTGAGRSGVGGVGGVGTYRIELVAEYDENEQPIKWVTAARIPLPGQPRQMDYGAAEGMTRAEAESMVKRMLTWTRHDRSAIRIVRERSTGTGLRGLRGVAERRGVDDDIEWRGLRARVWFDDRDPRNRGWYAEYMDDGGTFSDSEKVWEGERMPKRRDGETKARHLALQALKAEARRRAIKSRA